MFVPLTFTGIKLHRAGTAALKYGNATESFTVYKQLTAAVTDKSGPQNQSMAENQYGAACKALLLNLGRH